MPPPQAFTSAERRQVALVLMDMQRRSEKLLEAEYNPRKRTFDEDAVKKASKLTASDIEQKFVSFSTLHHYDATCYHLAVPSVLQALHASLEETGGAYPVGGTNLSFMKMGAAYESSPDITKVGVRISDEGQLITGPVEGSDIAMETNKIIESFVRKLYSILFVFHDINVKETSIMTGGKAVTRDTGGQAPINGISRHISVKMVSRYIEILVVEKLARTLSPAKLIQHLTALEKELRQQTSAPQLRTIDVVLENQLAGFRGGIVTSASDGAPPQQTTPYRGDAALKLKDAIDVIMQHADRKTVYRLLQKVRPPHEQMGGGGGKRQHGGEKSGDKRPKGPPTGQVENGVYPDGRYEKKPGGNPLNPQLCTNNQCHKGDNCYRNHREKA